MAPALKRIIYPFWRVFKFLRKPFMPAWHSFVLFVQVQNCKLRYRQRLASCCAKVARGEKIRVMFLVSEVAKWKAQSLYDLMKSSDIFEPYMALKPWGDDAVLAEGYEHYLRMVDYYKRKRMSFVELYSPETGCQSDLTQFTPDIVFYEQPWFLARKYMPAVVSKFALACYVPYFVPTHDPLPHYYGEPFHRTLAYFFELNDQWCDLYRSRMNRWAYAPKFVGSGHTFLDYYWLNRGQAAQNRRYVIYAPHWSFDHPNNKNRLNISTFLENGEEILRFAQEHKEVNWVFKPHPNLAWKLVKSGAWTKEKTDAYFKAWEDLAVCCLDADYLELFMQSKVMITDCGSFLSEYPPCGGALVHLLSPTQKLAFTPIMQPMFDTFYKVHDDIELKNVLNMLLVRGEDPMLEQRKDVAQRVGLMGRYAAQNIVDFLVRELKGTSGR